MKTTNNVQKTENRNFKTSVMKTFAVLTSVVLFSFISNATTNSHKELRAGINYEAEMATETTMEVEDWMINENFFFNAEASFSMDAATEESPEVESWMTSESLFAAPIPVAETEEPSQVEEWMLNNENFSAPVIMEESDRSLEVESWMISDSIWGQ